MGDDAWIIAALGEGSGVGFGFEVIAESGMVFQSATGGGVFVCCFSHGELQYQEMGDAGVRRSFFTLIVLIV